MPMFTIVICRLADRSILDGVSLKVLTQPAVPLHEWRAESNFEEGTEILGGDDGGLVRPAPASFRSDLSPSCDLQWPSPSLIEQLVDPIVNPFKDYQSAERPLPAYAVHLMTTLLARDRSLWVRRPTPSKTNSPRWSLTSDPSRGMAWKFCRALMIGSCLPLKATPSWTWKNFAQAEFR